MSGAPFEPASWLDRYVALGGCYSVVGGAVWLGHPLILAPQEVEKLRVHADILGVSRFRRDAVKRMLLDDRGAR